MELFVILVVLGSAVLHAVWNAIIKGGPDKLAETALKADGGALIALTVLPFLPLPLPQSWPYLFGTMTCHLFYYLFVANAYRGADMSYAYTIMRGSSPLFTALVSVFILHEALGAGGWAGVLTLSAGVLVLAVDAVRRGAFNLQATVLALSNALVIMGYSVSDGHGVRISGNTLSYLAWAFFLNAVPFTLYTFAVRRGGYLQYVKKRWKYGMFGGLCSVVAYGLALWAMTRAPVPMVAALRETSVVFGMLFAVIFLKETVTPARIAAVFLVLAGAIMMRF
ncbi:DMT family transporter [Desulfovibrio sp. OttesenSCG-928-O18]|nr:DMT family transporter [Desulfovibrio sp. OttesenSCG-928-O18]